MRSLHTTARVLIGLMLLATSADSTQTKTPTVQWTRELGDGFSGIVASGDRLFTMFRRGAHEVLTALDARTGMTRWEHAMATAAPQKDQDFSQGQGPHAKPALADSLLCAAGVMAQIRCVDASSGRLLWSRDLVTEYGASRVFRGYSSSPLIYQRTVIVQAGGKAGAIVAFDSMTGKHVWRSGNYENTNSSPALLTIGGVPHVVAFMTDVVAGFDAATGRELWSHPHPQQFDDNITTPVLIDHDSVLLTSALDGGTRLLRITRDGERWHVTERWHQPRIGAYYTNIVRVGDLLVTSSGGASGSIFSALRVTSGNLVWQSRAIRRAHVAVSGSGRLILRDEGGQLLLATVNDTGVHVSAQLEVLDEGAPSPPTVVGHTVYARDRRRMVALTLPDP